MNRAKRFLSTPSGQFIAGEGVYSGNPGSKEMETSTVNGSNTTNVALNPWAGLTGATDPGANVYNAAAFTSPFFAPTTNRRAAWFLEDRPSPGVPGRGGAVSCTDYVNTAP